MRTGKSRSSEKTLGVGLAKLPTITERVRGRLRMAIDGWNSRDPAKVALAYTPDSQWRNRAEFLSGRGAIEAFLARKWTRELDCRLIKELWAFTGSRIAVRFAYEYRGRRPDNHPELSDLDSDEGA